MVDDEPRNTGPPAGWKPANGVWTLLSPCSLQDHAGKGFSIRKGRKCPIETNHVTSPLVVVQTNHDSMMKYASTDSEKSLMEQVYQDRSESDNPFIHQFHAENVDNAVENWLMRWIRCGQTVENPVIALQH